MFYFHARGYTVEEAATLVTNLSDGEFDDVDEVQLIQLYPEKVDNISDEEKFYEEELRPANVSSTLDTVGELEIHFHGGEFIESTSIQNRKFQWKKRIHQPACGMDDITRDNTKDIEKNQLHRTYSVE